MKSNRLARYSYEKSLQTEKEGVFSDLIRCVMSSNEYLKPLAKTVDGYLRSRRWDLLLKFADSVSETEYSAPAQHFAANQIAALIKKYPFKATDLGVDPKKAALEKFAMAERQCGRYNKIFSLEHKLKRRRESFSRDIMREFILSVLGEKPDYRKIFSLCDFGPGASVGVTGNATHLARKFLSTRWSVTPTALPLALAALKSDPLCWELLCKKEGSPFYSVDPDLFDQVARAKAELVAHNKITLVPKTAKVHRTIAVEPLLNGYLQKGIDVFMRRRLKARGIDLNDQSHNQELARQGSLPDQTDPFVTIDLSSASDSISIGLAKDLLPPEWFSLLNETRSVEYELDGVKKRYNKFCSMGNGFCFPLETLIFASVCVAAYDNVPAGADFSVYGDDIIVRQSVSKKVLYLLRLLGFRHNPDKTFLSGPFRESCGADWYNGKDVRPITLDYEFDSLSSFFKFHNVSLRHEYTNLMFSEARDFLRAKVPSELRLVRPFIGNDDTAFEVDLDTFMASKFATWNRKTWSWSWTEMMSLPVSDNSDSQNDRFPTVMMMAALRGSSSSTPFTKRRNTRTRMRVISHHGGSSTWLPSPNEAS